MSSEAEAETKPKPIAETKPNNVPNWEVKQHLYGVDMIEKSESNSVASVTMDADGTVADKGGEALPLPETYITCGKCKSLFAIADGDLGAMGKGCRVQCSACGNSWFQSRERLFDIPKDSHDLLPAEKCNMDRIARNLARDLPPNWFGDYKLYVGNLDFRTTPDELLYFFEGSAKKEGSVCDVSIVKGPDGRSRGFAFVTFYDAADGKVALENGNGAECNGRELSVREPNN